MAQRFLSIVTAAFAGAAIVGCIVLWQASQRQAAALEANFEAQRAALAAIVAKISEPREAPTPFDRTVRQQVSVDGSNWSTKTTSRRPAPWSARASPRDSTNRLPSNRR